jgi:glycosyltransferase involved in cell wall biosynthesis
MRILILSHYYAPEVGAPQTRLRETVRELCALGHEVHVVTGPPHYPDGAVRPGYRANRPSRERIDGTTVLRLPMIPRPNGDFLNRTIDQASFAGIALAAVGEVRWSNVMIVESPPLFLGATAAIHRMITRRPYVFHVADPWPDIPIATGALSNPLAQRIGFWLEETAYRSAALITTVSPGLVAALEAKPGARGKVRLLPNAVDLSRFPEHPDRAMARSDLGWSGDAFILVYAGSVGLAQGLGTLLDAAARLDRRDIEIRIVGEGFERRTLANEVESRGIRNVHFESPVPSDRIPTVLAASDGVLTLLRRNPIYEHAMPTKLLEGLAAGRPLIVSAAGEASSLVDHAGAGLVCEPENPTELARTIQTLAAIDPSERAAMGAAGRRLAESTYDRALVVGRLAGYLEEAIESGSPRPSFLGRP